MLFSAERAMLERTTNLVWNEGSARFDIAIPHDANIARDTVGRQVERGYGGHPGMVFERLDGGLLRWTFAELDEAASRLAAQLRRRGLAPGDRIAVHTGPRPETGIAHLAIYKLGGIAVTLSQLYGVDTVCHVLVHSGARACITQAAVWSAFRGMTERFPALEWVIVVDGAEDGEADFWDWARAHADGFEAAATRADDPALLMYTSGSTGMPKGLLHGHRILHAYSPTVQMFYDLELDDPGLVMWTPSDWAWVGGLLDLLLPAWEHGQTVVTSEHRFEAEWAYAFLARHGVTHAFLAPTALKRLAEIERPLDRWDLRLRVICTGGEPLPSRTLQWIEDNLGVVCNEFYGLTEVNHLVGNCRRLYAARPGSMGRAYPGHGTTLVDDHGVPVGDGEVGMVVAPADDPTRFLGYWNDPERTAGIEAHGWLHTGDTAVRDEDGYFWYEGRADDLIKTAGYRVGPAEVENALLKHAAVVEAAVVGIPDDERGQIVKAFVRLANDQAPSDALAQELQRMVKRDLAAYKYPRAIEFVTAFPLTSSGKIDRRALAEREPSQRAGDGSP